MVIMAMLGHTGDEAAGEAAMAPFRALAKPLGDLTKPMAYPEMFPPEDPSYRPLAVGHTMFVNRVGLESAKTMVDAMAASDAPLRAVQLRVLGGAMARVPIDATAFAHRQSKIMAQVVSFYEGPDDYPRRKQWVEELAAAIDDGAPGAYVNFLESDEPDGVHRAYPGKTFDRLAEIKSRYDPANLFRLNHNVQPAR
jgi:hypothetical protein